MQRLYLLDAYALIYRAYYGLINAPRINSKGQNTSAVYGFVNTLEEVRQKERPDLLAIAFDPAGPTFRHEAYAEYKAQREATPEDIRSAVPVIKDIARAYRIPLLEVPGYEADDVIGTVAKMAARAGYEVRMITPDKDYAQLVEPAILMQKPGRAAQPWELMGPAEVCAKYGFERPEQMIDYLALMGDAADNIPGCPGVGPKTATKLVAEFGTVENLIASTDRLKGALRKKIEEHTEDLRFSKFLTRIKTDVPLPDGFSLDGLAVAEPDKEALLKIFTQLEFRTLIDRVLGKGAQKAPQKAPEMLDLFASEPTEEPEKFSEPSISAYDKTVQHYTLLDNEEDIAEFARSLLTKEKVSLDTETTSVDALCAKMVGMSISFAENEAFYIPVFPDDDERTRNRLAHFRPFFEDERIAKIGQNMKYDLTVLGNYGCHLRGTLLDTMLAHYVLQPEQPHNMDALAEAYLHYRTIHIDQLIGPRSKNQRNMADLTPQEIYEYACEDADVTLRLWHVLEAELAKEPRLERVFREIEMPLMPVLARMERHGVRLDVEALNASATGLNERMLVLEHEIHELAGHAFTITSPRQVGEVLFGELKLADRARKTRSGQYSTSEEDLQKIRSKHPIVQKILDYRGLRKLLNTYIEALPKLVDPATGRIHTSFNQAVTATGRLSSSNPNLQNIPVRGEDGREIRKAFVPEPGEVFLSADYSQVELRIMAHLSGDPHMLAAFREGHDVHAATAMRIYKKESLDDVTRDERRKAKTANFGIIYGISAYGLRERLDIPIAEAKDLIANYFATYPKVRDFIDSCHETARRQGYIETEFGRRRYLPDITSHNSVVRGFAERNAVNAPIQGTAADIIKIAMIRIDRRLHAEGLHAAMVLQVHDELNFSVPVNELDAVRRIVVEEMEHAYAMSVPLVADCGTGENWLEAH